MDMTKKRTKRIGLTYDLRTDYIFKPGDPQDISAEFDHPNTVGAIADAIESAGHAVVKIGNIHSLLENIDALDVDIVFNICEGMNGRNRESQVPMMLELKGIPFVGADALSLGIALDKVITKKILYAHNIPTPEYTEIDSPNNINGSNLEFPVIVKPRFEGSSKGLNDDSIVMDRAAFRKQVDWLLKSYKQPVIAERFIRGQEFTVAIIGNNPPKALPVIQIQIDDEVDLGDRFYTFSLRHYDSLAYLCPARISKKMQNKLQELAIATHKATECRDFSRVDLRIDKDMNPYVLEINPLPSLSTEDAFGVLGQFLGVGYDRMVLQVLDAAIKRYGL